MYITSILDEPPNDVKRTFAPSRVLYCCLVADSARSAHPLLLECRMGERSYARSNSAENSVALRAFGAGFIEEAQSRVDDI